MLEHRRFYRHPTEIPVEVWNASESDLHFQHLHNVSLGGLAFESDANWQQGSIVGVRILINPPFELFGRVVWCREKANTFEVGVEFTEKNQDIKNDMVEEVCQIEMYKDMLVRIAEDISDSEANMLNETN
jgi:hypothetical protein